MSTIGSLRKMAITLGYGRPELRVRHRDCATDGHRWAVSLIEEGQVSGPAIAEEQANCAEVAIDLLEKQLVGRIKDRIREHEDSARQFRSALPLASTDTKEKDQ